MATAARISDIWLFWKGGDPVFDSGSIRILPLCAVLLAGCIGSEADSSKPIPKPVAPGDAKSAMVSLASKAAAVFEGAATAVENGDPIPKVHDDIREQLKAARLQSFEGISQRLDDTLSAEPKTLDRKAAAELLRKIASEYRGVK